MCPSSLLRGNVETRLRKVESGEVDGTLLALAGLKRLGLADKATAILPLEDFLPAAGQGAIAITKRAGDARVRDALAPIARSRRRRGALGRARLSHRARRLLPHADRRSCAASMAMRSSFMAWRCAPTAPKSMRRAGAGPPIDAALIGDDAANEILLRLPHGVAGLS